MSDFLTGSICLSDVPKELFKKAGNGKIYLSIGVSERKEVSVYGDTHNIIALKPKEQRTDGELPLYIGNLKKFAPVKPPTVEEINSAPPANEGDLPF